MGDETDERLLLRLVTALSAVPGVRAIVLGASRARGTATAHSDYHIGLYYEAGARLDVAAERLERHTTAFVARVTATLRNIGLGLFAPALTRLEQLVEETTALQTLS